MQENTVIQLSALSLVLVSDDAVNKNGAVYNELLTHLHQIEELLIRYHFTKRERVMDLYLDEDNVIVNSKGEGSFIVNYTIGVFNACADLDHNDKTKMIVKIQIDLKTGETILTGEYIPEREPDF